MGGFSILGGSSGPPLFMFRGLWGASGNLGGSWWGIWGGRRRFQHHQSPVGTGRGGLSRRPAVFWEAVGGHTHTGISIREGGDTPRNLGVPPPPPKPPSPTLGEPRHLLHPKTRGVLRGGGNSLLRGSHLACPPNQLPHPPVPPLKPPKPPHPPQTLPPNPLNNKQGTPCSPKPTPIYQPLTGHCLH